LASITPKTFAFQDTWPFGFSAYKLWGRHVLLRIAGRLACRYDKIGERFTGGEQTRDSDEDRRIFGMGGA
jgi:hypothetical protein